MICRIKEKKSVARKRCPIDPVVWKNFTCVIMSVSSSELIVMRMMKNGIGILAI